MKPLGLVQWMQWRMIRLSYGVQGIFKMETVNHYFIDEPWGAACWPYATVWGASCSGFCWIDRLMGCHWEAAVILNFNIFQQTYAVKFIFKSYKYLIWELGSMVSGKHRAVKPLSPAQNRSCRVHGGGGVAGVEGGGWGWSFEERYGGGRGGNQPGTIESCRNRMHKKATTIWST